MHLAHVIPSGCILFFSVWAIFGHLRFSRLIIAVIGKCKSGLVYEERQTLSVGYRTESFNIYRNIDISIFIYRNIDIVFRPPFPGIRVFFMLRLNESCDVSPNIEVVSICFFVYSYRVELGSRSISDIDDIEHRCERRRPRIPPFDS